MASYFLEKSSNNANTASSTTGNVLLETSMGKIEIELYWKHAPNTCKNFYELAKRGYYNKTIFHRIVKVTCNTNCIQLIDNFFFLQFFEYPCTNIILAQTNKFLFMIFIEFCSTRRRSNRYRSWWYKYIWW